MITCIPNLHLSTQSKATGSATVAIVSRADISHTGIFKIEVNVIFDPVSGGYPTGTIKIAVDLSDFLKAIFTSTTVELINSFGKHNPTTIFTGRCKVPRENIREPNGYKYWVIIADNNNEKETGTPDIVGFVVTDRTGNRIAYGMGPVKNGDLTVDPA